MKFLLAPLALIASFSSASAFVESTQLQKTMTSSDNKLAVYEATSSSGGVFYYVDVLNGSASYAALAISGGNVGPYGGQDLALGSPDPSAGVYAASQWSTFSSIPFATLFGPTDTSFTIIRGSNPITEANDHDGTADLNTTNFTASRIGNASSAFVAFAPGGSIIASSSGVVPEPSTLICSALGAFGLLVRRRR